jgi:Biotin-requiring enzyme
MVSYNVIFFLHVTLEQRYIGLLGETRKREKRVPPSHSTSSLHYLTRTLFIYRNLSPRSPIGVFEPLCEVQSDKASVEITSLFDGTVKEILVQEGQIAKVSEDLCIIDADEEVSNASDVAASEHRDANINKSRHRASLMLSTLGRNPRWESTP